MESTISPLNIGAIKLDKFFSRFWDDFLNNEIPIILEHDPNPIGVVIIEIL
jgi:hypothetical protein